MALIKKITLCLALLLFLITFNSGINKTHAQVSKWDSFNREIGFGSYSPLFLNYRYNPEIFVVNYKKRVSERWSFATGLAFGFNKSGNINNSIKSQSFILDWGLDYRLIRRRIFLNVGPVLTWGYGNWENYVNGLIAENQFYNFLGLGLNAELGLRITKKISVTLSNGRSIGNLWMTRVYHSLSKTDKDIYKGFGLKNRNFSTTVSLRF